MLQSRQGFGHLLRRTITEFQGSITYLQSPVPSATFHQLPSSTYLQSPLPAATSQHLPTIYGSSSTYIYHSTDYPPSSTSTSLLSESAGPRDLRDLYVEDSGPTLHHRRLDYCGAASDLPSLPATDRIVVSVNEVTGFTPSFLVYGRELVSCGTHYNDCKLDSDIIFEPRDAYAENLGYLATIFNKVQAALLQAHARNCQSYNLRRKPSEYNIATAMVPSPTYNLRFHQLPSISYLPAATYRFSAPTYNLRFIIFITYIYHSTDYLPSSTSTSLLSESAGPRDFATFASKTAGLPCITDGWTTAELRATYPLYRLLTG
ncbi:hypothetical protein SFRURICE_003001 [Spodoptera frugiperda]|nr:hypothetical protein SFRURICE_003001 [Spodoptera frugiperda]